MKQTLSSQRFAYLVMAPGGHQLRGEMEALDVSSAQTTLESLQLTVVSLERMAEVKPAQSLSSTDLQILNDQLVHLTRSGLPIQKSLGLMARDLEPGRMRAALEEISQKLEKGQSLSEAFVGSPFPKGYARLVEAGIQSGDLAGMLMTLARHQSMLARLRTSIWQALAYPMVVAMLLLVATGYIFFGLFPAIMSGAEMLNQENVQMFRWMAQAARWYPVAITGLLILILGIWICLRRLERRGVLTDFLRPVPLLGPWLRWDALSRWCAMLSVAVRGGLSLPEALEMASQASTSRRLQHEGLELQEILESGRSLTEIQNTRMLPPAMIAAMEHGSQRGTLPAALESMEAMSLARGEIQLQRIPVILTPLILLVLGGFVALNILAMILPLIRLLSSFEG